MAEILSQREVDDLLAELAQAEPASRPPTRRGDRQTRVRLYDFKRPDKFSKDQIRTLEMLHENIARLLTTSFSAYFRTMVQVTVASVDQMTYEEFIQGTSNPTVLAVFSLEPLTGNAMAEIQPAIAFPMIDRLFGGPGNMPERMRPLTEIEHTVMERVMNNFLGNLAEGWKNIVELKPRLEAIEANPVFAQILASNDIVVGICLDLKVGENRGLINLCLPYLLLEPVMSRLSAHLWISSQHRGNPDCVLRLRQHVGNALVPVAVQLGHARITVGELLGLQPGDVVQLDELVVAEALVRVGDEVKFTGHPGTVGRRMAVRIARVLDEGGGPVNG